MRHRVLIFITTLFAILVASCSSAVPEEAAADRAVGDESPSWDVEQTILRSNILEGALDAGLTTAQAACVIDTTLAAGDFSLSELEGIDLTTDTSSRAGSALASTLADSLISCGPSLRAYLNADIPGYSSIPATHSVQNDCITNSYVEAWRTAYTDRFSGATVVTEPTVGRIAEITDARRGIIAGCDAGGAVILGASNSGHIETARLHTLEWICLDSRVDPDAFMPALPFPDEPGDALERMGNSIQADVAFCESWVDNGDDPAEAEIRFNEVDEALN